MEPARHRRIQELRQAQGECSVGHLARECGVSLMTVRRDLATLAEAGRVMRSHGGASPVERVKSQTVPRLAGPP